MINGGEALLEALKSHGVEYIFSSPGTEWPPVWESLARRYNQGDRTIKYINCRHETTAVAAALGYARVSGRLPAVLLHANAGVLNGVLAIHAAYRTQTPMIICTGDIVLYGEDVDGKFGSLNNPPMQGPGLSDIGGNHSLVRSYVKWSNAVTSKDTLVGSVYRGCAIAQAAPQGPVVLSIPWEFLVESHPEVSLRPVSPMSLPSGNPGDLEAVAQQLLESKQPVIITGYAGNSAEANSKLVELAELLSIPVFESGAANFPKDHPLYCGYNATEALTEADTIFLIGATAPWRPSAAFPQNNARVIYVDQDPLNQRLPYWGYRVDLMVSADIGQFLSALVDIIRARLQKSDNSAHRDRFERSQAQNQLVRQTWESEALAEQSNEGITTRWFLYAASKVLPDNCIITDETITHGGFIQRYLSRPGAYYRSGMGLGMGAAAGIKLVRPEQPVIFIAGDGGFNYTPVLAGLGLMQEYHLPVLTIILNNASYAAMKSAHLRDYPQGLAVKEQAFFGVDITPLPNYAKIAEVFGGYGERLEKASEIEPALNRALEQIAEGKPAILDVILEDKDPRVP